MGGVCSEEAAQPVNFSRHADRSRVVELREIVSVQGCIAPCSANLV
jgi:hypothetical protein